ncbi:MAG: DUF4974 domain-containing protein [Petrimonas sp.]|uniref:FecR family protein n=1 Tax=Petrimonas sp. TaxID=2023866 RepID=UPI002B3BA987|nr:DUF4974 domain-containing protein [Petrimonas sp.]
MKQDIEILIARLFNETLSSEEKERLVVWCGESAENKQTFARMKNIWDAAHPAFPAQDIHVDQAEAKIVRKIRKGKRGQIRFLVWWQRAAAVIVVPLLVVSLYLFFNRQSKEEAAFSRQEIIAPKGTYTQITLPDGSTVWLNSGSKLSYSIPFKKSKRETFLEGEAFFDVKANPKRPFIVVTDGISITATGTKFNVDAYLSDTLRTITLEEGRVLIESPQLHKKTEMDINRQFVWNTNTDVYNVYTVDASLYGKWKEGILIFRDETLENIFKRVERTFNVDISVKDPALAKQRYRATFEQESLDEILELLRMSAPIRYDFNGDKRNPKKIIEVSRKN